MKTLTLFIFLLPFAFPLKFLDSQSDLTDRPIIGLLTMPSDFTDRFPRASYSDFGAAYVKFLEASGNRVVPILYDYDEETLRKLFNSVNGLLFPGGDASLWVNETAMTGLSNLTLTVKKLLKWAVEANEQGDYFPVWGTCLGFESIVISFSENTTLDTFNDADRTHNLTFLNNDSYLFRNLPENLKIYTENQAPVFLWHSYGKSYDAFLKEEKLQANFKINTISNDTVNKVYVSSIEHLKYPIFATQFHPEVTIFQYGPYVNAKRDEENIQFSQYLTNFINEQARKNGHKFESQEEENKFLIYNYSPIKYLDGFYEQAYIFSNP